MARKFINCVEVMRGGKKVWRARLFFPFDKELGYKPAPKDFYAKTAAEADALRRAYVPEKKTLDKSATFLQYIEKEFLSKQEELARAGHYTWSHFEGRKDRLTRFLISPQEKKIESLPIRRVVLGSIRPDHIQGFFHALTVAKVGNEYRRKLKDDLSIALQECKKRIPEPWRNYFEDVKAPASVRRFSQRELFDWRVVCQSILDDSKPLRERALVAIAMHTLRRPSELFALKWKDIDWKRRQIVIRKAMRKTADGYQVQDRTKNGVETMIELAPIYLDLLKQLKSQPGLSCEKCGYGETANHHRVPRFKHKIAEGVHHFSPVMAGDNDYIFTTTMGLPLNKENFKGVWKSIKKNLELPDGPTFYSFKHMANTAAQERGVSVGALADRMGHTTDIMARLTYRNITDEERHKATSVFEDMLALARPKQTP